MKFKPNISLYLDTRRPLASGLYPVKLHVTFTVADQDKIKWVHKYYPCSWRNGKKIEAAKKVFNSAISRYQSSVEATDMAERFREIESGARDILKKHDYVNVEIFERLLNGNSLTGVGNLFERYIADLKAAGRAGTAMAYNTAMNSIKEFGGDPSFIEISADWLTWYTTWMRTARKIKVGEEEKIIPAKSITTVAMYLRCLRKIYNDAIYLKYISADYYPFGKRQYSIQEESNPKTALSIEQKDLVLEFKTDDPEIRKALDFWILSYFCNGMNFTDIAHLKNGEVKDGIIYYNRQKTIRTNRVLRKIEVPLRKEALKIVNAYRRPSLDPEEYVFPILDKGLTPSQAKYRIQDFIDDTNKGLRTVARDLKFNFKFTTYTARHTFANISLQKGHTKEMIQESLGHGSVKTTEVYTAGFATEAKRKRGMDL